MVDDVARKRAIANGVRSIVETFYVEPRPGFIQNEATVYLTSTGEVLSEDGAKIDHQLAGLISVSVEGRSRNGEIAIVRDADGNSVFHEFHHIYTPGDWESVVLNAASKILSTGDEPRVLADLVDRLIAA